MNKKTTAALAALTFVAGCEIGIAIQLMKMIHKYMIREEAINEETPEGLKPGESELEVNPEEEVPEEEVPEAEGAGHTEKDEPKDNASEKEAESA